MDYNQIKIELDRKGMSIRDLCLKIDITEQGLHQMIRNKSMKIEVLERISHVIGRPMAYWFKDEFSGQGDRYAGSDADEGMYEKQITPNIIHQKIDSLTKDLNEMLKDIMISKQ
ncbi:MAG: helix-turn-helix domain-containing protein [Bacteroidales bacterium]|jgi:transcriptional regulator with XRE-family HTH domain|nr:helix-turn-helix domain-containing protein [Bacteroidales bacterium]